MGATAWEHRGNHEIARLEVRRARSGSPTDGLTPTQQTIAELVATGRTNAEIAATMFVSVRTVESHLTRSYRMLGIRSRTELARFVAESATPHPQQTRDRLGVIGKPE